MEEIKDILKGYSLAEQKLVLFRSFLELEPERSFYVLKKTIGKVEDALKLYITALFVRSAIFYNLDENVDTMFEYDYDYDRIIDNFIKLSEELDMNSSFELSNLYTYMLWNGYFSKDKKMVFTPIKQLHSLTALSHEVMNGKGVCLNTSAMLTDILNKAGYNSAVLTGYSSGISRGYRPPIDVKLKESEISNPKSLIPSELISRVCGNHAVSLVGDNNGMYIYDPQNIKVFGIKNKKTAKANNGGVTLHLKPFLSYYVNDKEKNSIALTRFLTSDNYHLPCSKKRYQEQWENQIEKLEYNKTLLNAFYSDVRINIDRVNDKMDRAKRLVYK